MQTYADVCCLSIQVKGVKYLNLDSESSVRWSGYDAGLIYFLGGYMLVIYFDTSYIYIYMYVYIYIYIYCLYTSLVTSIYTSDMLSLYSIYVLIYLLYPCSLYTPHILNLCLY